MLIRVSYYYGSGIPERSPDGRNSLALVHLPVIALPNHSQSLLLRLLLQDLVDLLLPPLPCHAVA